MRINMSNFQYSAIYDNLYGILNIQNKIKRVDAMISCY